MPTPPHAEPDSGQPAVGNVLGFALLLRHRQALLRLDRRALAPGLRLLDYEAEVPDVEFPLRTRGAAAFRRKRTQAHQLRLETKTHAIASWLRSRLVGHTLAGVVIDTVDLELWAETSPDGPRAPRLCLGGRLRGLPQWLMFTLCLRTDARTVTVSVWQAWRLGEDTVDEATLWIELATRVGAVPDADEPSRFRLDVVRPALLPPFMAAGWRPPDLSHLRIEAVDLSEERALMTWGRQVTTAAPIPDAKPSDDDRIGPRLESIRTAIAQGQRGTAATKLERLADDLPPGHPGRLAALQWLARLARNGDPAQERRALAGWLHLAPRDTTAAQQMLLALGRSGDDHAMARRLTAQCRLPHPPRRQARLELALATVLVDRLDETAAGRHLLTPLLDRCLSNDALADLEGPVRSVLARALAMTPSRALAQLDRALDTVDRAATRASMLAALAAALDRAQEHEHAGPLWAEVVSIAPDDDDLVDQALISVRATADPAAAVALLRPIIAAAPPPRADALRRTLVSALLEVGDEASYALALAELRELTRRHPEAKDLARQLASLESDAPRPEQRADRLGEIATRSVRTEDRARLRLEQSRLLVEQGQPRRAWNCLRPVLDSAPLSVEPELLEVAIEIAPLSIRDRLLDRLVEIDHGPRSGRALLARAHARTSESKRRADLALAAERLDDPREALAELAALSEADALDPWRAWADACAAAADEATEITARTELALRAMAKDQLAEAGEALARIRSLAPPNDRIDVAAAWIEIRRGHPKEAARLLGGVALDRLTFDTPPLDDARLGLPDLSEFQAQAGSLLLEGGRAAEAARVLRVVFAQHGALGNPMAASDLVAALEASEEAAEAATVAHALAQSSAGKNRAQWLARAARHAGPHDAANWLAEAIPLDPDDASLAHDLERAARKAGHPKRLEFALERLATHAAVAPEQRARALRALLARRRSAGGSAEDTAIRSLYERLLSDAPNDVDALLALAEHDQRSGDLKRAHARWSRALEHLPARDARRIEPTLAVARFEIDNDDAERARGRLLTLVEHPAAPRRAHELLAEASAATSDDATQLRALRGLLSHTPEGPARRETALALARALGDAGRAREALPHIKVAIGGLLRGTPDHIDAARLWLSLAIAADEPKQEAAARSALRRSLGPEVSAKEIRTEALLRAERLGDTQGARGLVEDALTDRPTDSLLLSTLKPLALATGSMRPYLEAVEAAVEAMQGGDERDRLSAEFATAAAEDGDGIRVLRALDRMTGTAAAAEEMLDLREWAVRSLGREAEELQQLDECLSAGAVDPTTLGRLQRMLGDVEPTIEHLLELLPYASPEVARRLVAPAVEWVQPTGDASLMMRVLRHAVRVEAQTVTETAWPALVELVSTTGDDAAVADLMALGNDARAAGMTIDDRLDRLLDASIAHLPNSRHLHRALARHLAQPGMSPERLQAELMAHLDAVADRYELPGRDRADLFIGTADPLDRRTAADLLAARAEQYLDEPEAFARLLEALEARQCWPEVLRLLEARANCDLAPEARVTTLKHLAHVASDVLGDPGAAVVHLEAALDLAPTDPDLLLPLLDHHFSQTDLSRAITLTERVLEHVRMGDAAFAALAHRAADAAIAQDHTERATALLERISTRIPADEKARLRLEELQRRASQPDQRVQLLAAIAARQSGNARIEALEERARLLIEALDRPVEAMEDLAAVVADAPTRRASAAQLAELYRAHDRFDDLVALLESELEGHHGSDRAMRLRAIAEVHARDRADHGQAEAALRLALDELGPNDGDSALAHSLREALVDSLDRQGRHLDLGLYLEHELTPDLALVDDGEPSEGGPRKPAPPPAPRVALVERLARITRDHLDNETRAAELYECLEHWGALPDDGLATLARWYRRSRRHEDLVRVLQLRAQALAEHSERRAAVDLRIAELLDGPLVRPHDAAPYYLDAYLADPEANTGAGARARVLLSGVDSVVNVRRRLLDRLGDLDPLRRPALLTLLADILAPQTEHEDEAETRYREAIALDPTLAGAHEGLGRLLTRLQRHQEAAAALVTAASSGTISPARAAEAAAVAARNFAEIELYAEAESVLKQALHRLPDSQRALLELAHLYERCDRRSDLGEVLDRLAALPLSSTVAAEVAYRRALQLRTVYERMPNGPQGERARSHLLEAVGANPHHTAARRALLSLATARREWSIVAHMHYLALRELPPGTQRALVHLDLAATYLDHLGDPSSAMRNVESALQQAATDVVVANRTAEIARRMPVRRDAAERFENIAAADNELEDAARARLWLLAADLRMEDDDRAAATAASRKVLDLPAVPTETTAAANRTLARLHPQDPQSLAETGTGVIARLEQEPPPNERAELLGQLHDIGVALEDDTMVERATTEQRAMAADLDESDVHATTTGALLRDLLAGRGEYGPVVELYERLATQAGDDDPMQAATVLTEAAGYAWRGQDNPVQAASLLGRALLLAPDDPGAARVLDELVEETVDPSTAHAIATELAKIPDESRPPALRLHLATLAATRGADPEALSLTRALTGASIPEDVRFAALSKLDTLLSTRGDSVERHAVLQEFFALAKRRGDARAADLGLELALLQRIEGDRAATRHTCEQALEADPEHQGLIHLRGELAQADEDWATLLDAQRHQARLASDDHEQATWLAQAATTLLDHPDLRQDLPRGAARKDPQVEARELLLQACELDPVGTDAPLVLLPLSFRQARWDEVLSLAEGLLRQHGDDDEVLVLAALAQAHHKGERTIARDIGYRHSPDVCRRLLLPGLEQVLTEIALRGPLPRLDSVLAAASSLLGGRAAICDVMLSWASERPLQAGIALGLARLLEARGFAELARSHFQLAAFLAPRGPVPALVNRLPQVPRRTLDLHLTGNAPMGSHSILRQALASLRDHLAGLGTAGAVTLEPLSRPAPAWWHERAELAETLIEPWRSLLGLDLPLAWTEMEVRGGVTLRNDRPPRIVLSPSCADLGAPEFAFRLAHAAATIALGMAVLDSGTVPIDALLDALGQLANPAHRPTGTQALALADVLAARDAHNIGLSNRQRTHLLEELAHWLTTDQGPVRLLLVMRRARLLLACRLSDRLDGALHALSHDHSGDEGGASDIETTLQSADAQWLLRTLALR